MDDHYFSRDPSAPGAPRLLHIDVAGERLPFFVDKGVFSARRLDPGTALLLEVLPLGEGQDVLDLGCGWGPVGLVAKRRIGSGKAVLVDTNRRAVALARRTAELWGVPVDVREGNGLETLGPSDRFDLIATNPPIRAGKDVYYKWVEGSPAHLKETGAFYAVIRVRQGAETFERHLASVFGDVRREARRGGYRVLSARRPRQDRVISSLS